MNSYSFTPQADFDFEGIWRFIAGPHLDNMDAADQFIDRIVESLSNLAANPFMGRGRPELGSFTRSFPVQDYIIYYTPTDYGIEVTRIIHGSRDITRLF